MAPVTRDTRQSAQSGEMTFALRNCHVVPSFMSMVIRWPGLGYIRPIASVPIPLFTYLIQDHFTVTPLPYSASIFSSFILLCPRETFDFWVEFQSSDLAVYRAKFFGWPNTYVFTKAMGEMLLGHLREHVPLVIIRPTIITSTYIEPFPGWIQGMRTIDTLLVGYGKGKLTCFLGDPVSTIDVIPGDMVVNAMIVSMVAHSNQRSEFIYHVSSSVRNPMQCSLLEKCSYQYFVKKPCMAKDGRPIRVRKVRVFSTRDSFHRYMTLRYMIPLKGLGLINAMSCKFFQSLHNDLNRKYNFVMRLIEVYEPYLFFQGRFDDTNLERLRLSIKDEGKESQMLGFDPKCIDWEHYLMNIHIPGLMEHVSK